MSKNIKQVFDANPITSNTSTDLIYVGQSPYGIGNDAAITYANFSAQFPLTAGAGSNSGTGGGSNTVTGAGSFAWGSSNTVSDAGSFVVGQNNNSDAASDGGSLLVGFFNQSLNGSFNVALGVGNTCNTGSAFTSSYCLGAQNTASANYSFALGCRSTSAYQGSWMISDSTGSGGAVNPAPTAADQFVSMFLGGHYFYNANNSSTGLAVQIDSNGNLINKKGIANQSVSYQTPSTGFSITISDYTETLQLTPAGTLATGTVTMPANAVDGQIVDVASTQTVTACTFSPNAGQSMSNAPTTLTAGTRAQFRYRLSNTTWYALPGLGAAGITNGGISSGQILVASSSSAAVSDTDLTFDTTNNRLISGASNTVTASGLTNSVMFGTSNTYSGSNTHINCAILAGTSNTIGTATAQNCSIVSGSSNTANGVASAILCGTSQTLAQPNRSAIIFGQSCNVGGDNAIAGGHTASAQASTSFAMGNRAKTQSGHDGSFVWADTTTNTVFQTSAANQFRVRCSGGFDFATSDSVNAVQIDSNSNLINTKGTSDQSFSLQAPSTGFSITIGAGVKSLILNPAGTLATGTITMPASPINGQEIRVSTSQTITALTVSANAGQTISNAPTTLTAGSGFAYIYNLSGTNWYRLY